MAKKTVPLNIRASEDFKSRLDKAAEVLDVPASQIVRESVLERLERLASSNERLKRALELA
jgi:predicted transcriptional regulator